MIPKKIHYCWFGRGEKPKLSQKCIASWKKYCPDYEIIEWNEDNFDLDQNAYTCYCYDNKKWAFLSDFARLAVVSECGGFYFDTDVELLSPLDNLRNYKALFSFENPSYINTGQGFGAIPHHLTVEAMLQQYLNLTPNTDGHFQLVGCPKLNTAALLSLGLQLNGQRQNIAGTEILPAEYMNPYNDATGELNMTPNTISIHWYSKTWLSKKVVLRSKIMRPVHRIFGVEAFQYFRK